MTSSEMRIERDTFGPIEVPAEQLWGAQTQRALLYFRISDEKVPTEMISALLIVKRAAAKENAELGVLKRSKAQAIITAADEVLDGGHRSEFPLGVWLTVSV